MSFETLVPVTISTRLHHIMSEITVLASCYIFLVLFFYILKYHLPTDHKWNMTVFCAYKFVLIFDRSVRVSTVSISWINATHFPLSSLHWNTCEYTCKTCTQTCACSCKKMFHVVVFTRPVRKNHCSQNEVSYMEYFLWKKYLWKWKVLQRKWTSIT